jgi:hypothetical protein
MAVGTRNLDLPAVEFGERVNKLNVWRDARRTEVAKSGELDEIGSAEFMAGVWHDDGAVVYHFENEAHGDLLKHPPARAQRWQSPSLSVSFLQRNSGQESHSPFDE